MADEDDSSFLLSDTESIDGVDFSAASGINVSGLAGTVIGTIGLALGTAAATLVDGVTESWTRLIDGLTSFLAGGLKLLPLSSRLAREAIYDRSGGLIEALAGSLVVPLRAAWSSAVPDSGIASFLVALGTVIVTFWVASRGIEAVSEVLNDG